MYVVLACWFFPRIHQHAVRTGFIARYSAVSVNQKDWTRAADEDNALQKLATQPAGGS